MSGVFLLVEIDKNDPHVFAFDPQLQNAHLSGACSFSVSDEAGRRNVRHNISEFIVIFQSPVSLILSFY